MFKTYQFKTHCKGDIHSSRTADIILPELMTEYTCISEVVYSDSVT